MDSGGASLDAGAPVAPSRDPRVLAAAAVLLSSCVDNEDLYYHLDLAPQPIGSAAALLLAVYGSAPTPVSLGGLVRDHAECLATTANGCNAVETCLGLDLTPEGDCVPGCDGNTIVRCDISTGALRWNCDAVGLTCSDVERTCVAPPCTETGCMEGRPTRCEDGGVATVGTVCSDYGLDCQTTDAGLPHCEAAGDACSGGFSGGTAVVWMFGRAGECIDRGTLPVCVDRAMHALACDAVAAGMTCRRSSDSELSGYFCGLAGDCNPFGVETEYCRAGAEVGVCNAGRLDFVSCYDLGFRECVVGGCR